VRGSQVAHAIAGRTNAVKEREMQQQQHAEQLLAQQQEVAQLRVMAAQQQVEAQLAARKLKDQITQKEMSISRLLRGSQEQVQSQQQAEKKAVAAAKAKKEAEAANASLVAKAARTQELATEAHADKRAWRARAERSEQMSSGRLDEMKALQVSHSTARDMIDELRIDRDSEGLLQQRYLEAWARQQAMPQWRSYRARGRGGGRSFDFDYRVTIYAAIANQVPLSAIGPTIVDVVQRTASWLQPEAPSKGMLSESRFELRLIEEALGGRRVAMSYATRMLGFDETTKKGNPSITSNVIIEPKQGAPLEPVILRGAYCSAGGTSEAIAAAIEKKCFVRLRDLLRRWEEIFHKLFPGETWTGPKPEDHDVGKPVI
jgi:hypothetical protein